MLLIIRERQELRKRNVKTVVKFDNVKVKIDEIKILLFVNKQNHLMRKSYYKLYRY